MDRTDEKVVKPLNKIYEERIEGLENLQAAAILKGEHKLAERYEDMVLELKDFLSALKDKVEEIEKINSETVDVTKAKCEYCKKPVEAQAGFGQCWSKHKDKRKTELYNNIHTCWSCKGHGAVGAYIGKRYFHRPEDVFKQLKLMDKQKDGVLKILWKEDK